MSLAHTTESPAIARNFAGFAIEYDTIDAHETSFQKAFPAPVVALFKALKVRVCPCARVENSAFFGSRFLVFSVIVPSLLLY